MPDKRITVYQVAVPSPLRRVFDYLPASLSDQSLRPGCRVRVPFGKRQVVGIVVATKNGSDIPLGKLKPIAEILDPIPLVSAALFDLYLWSANYYQHPIGDALANSFPTLLRKGKPIPGDAQLKWRLSTLGLGLPDQALKRAPRQQQLLHLLQQYDALTADEIKGQGLSPAIVRQLENKGLIESFEQPRAESHWQTGDLLAEQPLSLNKEQQQAVDGIRTTGFCTYLLQGATGSGKTEVYLQLIEKIIRQNKQALVLIPEINLTPQTLQRFRSRFTCPVAVLHSGLSDRERAIAWNRARTGQAPIVLGTRSGIFTPLKNPGVLIVDEEHDSSYKQQDGFHYSARDVAVMRAKMEAIPLLLGSATPALETLHNSNSGRYTRLSLSGRAGISRPPEWQLINLRDKNLNAGFSAELIDAMADELRQNHQVLVFLNRRGYSPTFSCHSCGWIASCHRCEARLTLHLSINRLLCHHCEHQEMVPATCPDCRSGKLQCLGQGTERSEAILEALFPETTILRVDRDSTRKKNAMKAVFDRVNRGEKCILIGTQMLAKGHHFPNVTLVVILDADGGLFSADYRAPERMGQLITQVAGRAGRGTKPGRVILQSHHCDHPLIQIISQQGYGAFADKLLQERELAELPPFSFMAMLRAESHQRQDAEIFLRKARQAAEKLLPPSPSCRYLGPLPPAMERRSGLFRQQLTITCNHRLQLQKMLSALSQELEKSTGGRNVRWSIDVDPQEMA